MSELVTPGRERISRFYMLFNELNLIFVGVCIPRYSSHMLLNSLIIFKGVNSVS